MKRTALDALIEQDEKNLAYWTERKAKVEAEYWTPERMQETIDRLELSLHYSRKHRDEFRKKKIKNLMYG